ncbi:MAG: DNA repair protein RecN [Anaerolineaceae bacterium]|nr:DNA repair protein RecN [Anaerolineaceae bacterium]MCB9100785.1 DNA repair protein RecN [Anaerolineales bacterium]
MLVELNIEDFAIIEQLNLKFSEGFNVLTGETGAGKSIIIDAVTMLLGGRGDSTFIRAGSDRARIEGLFRLSPPLRTAVDPILAEEGLEGDNPDILILGRELRSTGRSFCRVNGSTVNLSLLEKIAAQLVDIHGQNEHISLMQVRQHLTFLDRYAGLSSQRNQLAAEVRQLRRIRQELADLQRDEQFLARRIDQLTFQVEEITMANLKPGEEIELNAERNRLANAEQLSQLSAEAYALLVEAGSDEQFSILDLLGQLTRVMNNLAKLDEDWSEKREMVDNLTYQVEDVATFVRDYNENIDFNPLRLQEIEERLGLIFSLKRKYGATVEDILEFGRKAQLELDNISHSEERIEALKAEQETFRQKIGQLALALSEARRQAGKTLAVGVETELADLSMEKAKFAVDIQWNEAADGVYVEAKPGEVVTVACDDTGIDRVEFLISPNPGEPLKPLAKVASGGETSRIMLALKNVLAIADETPTLIFDEIDQGIGGRIGGVVGQKLWMLASQGHHQVLCVTHLPQIAGYAELHYHVAKQVSGGRTKTDIQALTGEAQINEMAQMLGILSDSTRQSAREILKEAAAAKSTKPNLETYLSTINTL